MLHRYKFIYPLVLLTAFSVLFTGCGFNTQAADTGPIGRITKIKPPTNLNSLVTPAPQSLFDLETIAGTTFEAINKANWSQASEGLIQLQWVWQQIKPLINDPENQKSADEALTKLGSAINEQQVTTSCEGLNRFMSSISDISKAYKLSPLSDIIVVDNAVRDASFYIENKDWSKASSKMKQLENTWKQVKPGLEKIGILGQTAKIHSYVNQLKDAVTAENQSSAIEKLGDINAGMAQIRAYYQNK
ncbi:MAG: hypothetical protein H6Q74_621 [Firmicutes bacterium]|nr:hypothetical protein [Bacillota bacterium]